MSISSKTIKISDFDGVGGCKFFLKCVKIVMTQGSKDGRSLKD